MMKLLASLRELWAWHSAYRSQNKLHTHTHTHIYIYIYTYIYMHAYIYIFYESCTEIASWNISDFHSCVEKDAGLPVWEAVSSFLWFYRGADKSLARPGRKQANVSVRMTRISFGALPSRKKKNLMTARVSMLLKSRTPLTCLRACFLPGRAKDLSAPRHRRCTLHRQVYGVKLAATKP